MMKVVKLGGSLLDDKERRDRALGAIAAAWNAGEQVVLVHGGGKHIDAMLARLGIGKKTYAGLRITDDATLDVVVSVLGGLVNKMLVAELTAAGVRAAGISGSDAATLVAEKHPPIDGVDFLNVGRIVSSNATLVRSMLTYGILPVVSSIAMTADGALLNVNADSAAAALGVALRADTLQFITDVAGVLDADGEVVERLDAAEVEEWIHQVGGGMRPKLEAALSALRAGLPRITIGEHGGTRLESESAPAPAAWAARSSAEGDPDVAA
jgi:acetylglutamate kinase